MRDSRTTPRPNTPLRVGVRLQLHASRPAAGARARAARTLDLRPRPSPVTGAATTETSPATGNVRGNCCIGAGPGLEETLRLGQCPRSYSGKCACNRCRATRWVPTIGTLVGRRARLRSSESCVALAQNFALRRLRELMTLPASRRRPSRCRALPR